jgi:hypothetical protein
MALTDAVVTRRLVHVRVDASGISADLPSGVAQP